MGQTNQTPEQKEAADKLAAEKLAADKLAADKKAADKEAADKLAAEKKAADKLAAEKKNGKSKKEEITRIAKAHRVKELFENTKGEYFTSLHLAVSSEGNKKENVTTHTIE